jgi:hypothetical protein
MLPQALALAIGQPTDQRLGTVSAVTARGIDVSVGTGLVEGAAHLSSYNPAVGDTVIMARYADSWTVLGRLVGPGTPSDNLSPGTGLGFTMLDGMVLTQAGGAIGASTGSVVTVPRYGLSFYHPPSHWVALLISYTWFCTVATDQLQVSVYETVSGTTFWQAEHPQVPGASRFETYVIMAPQTFGGVARGYGLKVQRTSGSGTSQIEDHASRRGSFFAYDLGATSIIRTV